MSNPEWVSTHIQLPLRFPPVLKTRSPTHLLSCNPLEWFPISPQPLSLWTLRWLMRTAGTQHGSSSMSPRAISVWTVTDLYVSSQWDMAFSVNPPSVSSNSPQMPISNAGQLPNLVNHHQYPIPYDSPSKVAPPPTQSVSPPQFQAPQVVFSARDWQQSVASVYDPQGLKRRWNYSVDLNDGMSKRQRG